MKAGLAVGIVAAWALGASAGLAQDIEAGEAQYKEVCRKCHGPTAKGMASFPKLAGQTAEYLSERLMQYRNGEKVGPNTKLMAPNAAKLTDDEILNIATFIATNFD